MDSKLVKEAILRIEQNKTLPVSYCTSEFLMNIKIFIEDYEDQKVDSLKAWLQVYDVQAVANPIFMGTVLNPKNLPAKELCFFKNEFSIIEEFIEFVRNSI